MIYQNKCEIALTRGNFSFSACLRFFAFITALYVSASCSKPVPNDRHDRAMELASNYTIKEAPVELATIFKSGRGHKGEYFFDIALHPSFAGKFKTAAQKLAEQAYVDEGNAYLLHGIIADSALRCEFSDPPPTENVDCGSEGLAYSAERIKLLHTEDGDFIVSTANMDRGNGYESNVNASPLVIVVDMSDGGLGLILEDHIAISGGRKTVLAATLTLASVIGLANPESKNDPTSTKQIHYALEAGKSGTLFVKTKVEQLDFSTNIPTLTQQDNASKGDAPVEKTEENQPPAASLPSYTTERFKSLVIGKTMDEVRSALGLPSNVIENSDGIIWYYWSDKLQVTDPDAGIAVRSSSIFFDASSKVALRVTF